jgi:outer membrane protein TolC
VLARLAGVLSQQAVDQAKAQLARMQALEAAGRAAHADVLSAQVFVADSELSLSQIELQHSVAAQRLRIAISASPDETLAVGEDVLAPFAGEREAGSLEALCREAYQQRLELRALAASRSSLERLSSIESSRALPTLEAFGNLTYANPNQRVFPQEQRWTDTWDVGVRLVWTLNNIGTSLATGQSVEADANALSAQQRSVEQALRLEIATALGGLEQARLNVGTAQKGEEAAGAAWEARRLLHEHGRATALELMQAETATLQARLNLISAHVSLRSARVRLDHALGRDVSLAEAQTAAPR